MLKLGTQSISALYLGSKEIKKAYLGDSVVFEKTKPSKLPNGYTEVAYIEGAGGTSGPFINTGLLPTTTRKLVMEFEPTSTPTISSSYGGQAICGSLYRKVISGTQYIYNYWIGWSTSGVRGCIGRHANSGVSNNMISADISLKRKTITIDASSMYESVDSEGYTFSLTKNFPTSMGSIYLFWASGASSSTFTTQKLPAKLYSCQIFTGTTLARDFVPCIDPSDAVGLYDLIGSKFYKSGMTAQFTAGPAI